MREEPRENQVYKHFKGDYYQVITVAKHSETEEKLVVYRNLFSSDKVCARPLDMFMSEVDHEKYPDVKQKWRFALVTGTGKNSGKEKMKNEGPGVEASDAESADGVNYDGSSDAGTEAKEDIKQEDEAVQEKKSENVAKEDSKEEDNSVPESEKEAEDNSVQVAGEKTESDSKDDAADDQGIAFLDDFLDADTYEKKLDVFTGMWKSLNEDNIDNVALVMDLELRGTTLEEKYKEILSCLKMKAKYESSRLR